MQRLKKNMKSMWMIALNAAKYAKIVKNCQIIVKNVTKYIKTVNVILNTWNREK